MRPLPVFGFGKLATIEQTGRFISSALPGEISKTAAWVYFPSLGYISK